MRGRRRTLNIYFGRRAKEPQGHLSRLSSSRFVTSPTARLHARSVSPVKDHDRSVAVGIVPMPARGADEGRLVLAASAVHCPAGRAGLGRKGRINSYEGMRFIPQHFLNLVPAYIQDGSIQSALLFYVSPWGIHRTAARSCHVLCAQPLNDNCSILTGNGCGCFVRPVLSDTRLPCLEGSNSPLGLGVTSRPALSPRSNALRLADAPINVSNAGGKAVARSIGEHERNRYASINSNRASRIKLVCVDHTAKADVPAQSIAGDRSLSDIPQDRSRQPKLNPSHLRKPDPAPSTIDDFKANVAPVEAKSIIDAFLLRCGIASLSLPRSAVSIIKGHQRALKANSRCSADKIELSTKLGQLTRLRDVIQVVASNGLISTPVISALFKSKVPNQATDTRILAEYFGLIVAWMQRICEAAIDHKQLNMRGASKCQLEQQA